MFKFIKTNFDADESGHFGAYGGRYVPEMLVGALDELEEAYILVKSDETFLAELRDLFKTYAGRPTPLHFCKNLTQKLGGAKIFIKNEGLNMTGAHKMNHCLGQALLAKRMNKKKLVAETGAGQHGLGVATVAAKFGLECTIYMGEVDYNRQRPNVFWMEQLGAKVVPVTDGTKRLKDAAVAAMKHWIEHIDDTYFLLGSVIGPHPYPTIVKDFQTVVGLEVQDQIKEFGITKPDYCIACVGGGCNAIGLFNPFLDDADVKLIGVEPGGKGSGKVGEHAAKFQGHGRVGVVEGFKSLFLQNDDGQILPTHSISAGVDYSGVGPQHAYLAEIKRVEYVAVSDTEVLAAFQMLAKTEGIIAALESAHAVAHAIKLAPTLAVDKSIVVNLSGRGDKDLFILGKKLGGEKWKKFLNEVK